MDPKYTKEEILEFTKDEQSMNSFFAEHGYEKLIDMIHSSFMLPDNKDVADSLQSLQESFHHFLHQQPMYALSSKAGFLFIANAGDENAEFNPCVFLFSSRDRAERMLKEDHLEDICFVTELPVMRMEGTALIREREGLYRWMCKVGIKNLFFDSCNGTTMFSISLNRVVPDADTEEFKNQKISCAMHRFVQSYCGDKSGMEYLWKNMIEAAHRTDQVVYVPCKNQHAVYRYKAKNNIPAIFGFLYQDDAIPLIQENGGSIPMMKMNFEQFFKLCGSSASCINPYSLNLMFKPGFNEIYKKF